MKGLAKGTNYSGPELMSPGPFRSNEAWNTSLPVTSSSPSKRQEEATVLKPKPWTHLSPFSPHPQPRHDYHALLLKPNFLFPPPWDCYPSGLAGGAMLLRHRCFLSVRPSHAKIKVMHTSQEPGRCKSLQEALRAIQGRRLSPPPSTRL